MEVPELGNWLLRSRVQLAHSLINAGRWRLAYAHLAAIARWMAEHPPGRQRRGQEDQIEDGLLRRDEVWVETYQYLAIVCRDVEPLDAMGYLSTALARIGRRGPGAIQPIRPDVTIGNLQRDLAKVQLRQRRFDRQAVAEQLQQAQARLEQADEREMLAATHIARATLCSRIGDLNGVNRAIEDATFLADQSQSPILVCIIPTAGESCARRGNGVALVRSAPADAAATEASLHHSRRTAATAYSLDQAPRNDPAHLPGTLAGTLTGLVP